MKYILNGKEMKACDNVTIEQFLVPSLVLMERAALAVADFLAAHFSRAARVRILVGPGNNGADGLAVGRLLFDRGYDVVLLLACGEEAFSFDEKRQMDMAKAYQVPMTNESNEIKENIADADVIVDALFGTGLSRPVEGDLAELIDLCNASHAKTFAVDIPSGISSGDGSVLGTAMKCDATVTFGFYKNGHFLYPGKTYCGQVLLSDIGISARAFLDRKYGRLMLEEEDIPALLPKRVADSHKGTYGKLLIIAGSKDMAGAAAFSAKAAYHMGAGLVKIYTPQENRSILQTLVPEALLCSYESRFSEEPLLEQLGWADVILIGPGLGQESLQKKIFSYTMEHAAVPMVVDADGLNFLSQNPALLKRPHMAMVLTPHLGEMGRLTGLPTPQIKSHIIEQAEEFSRENDVILALKDATTVCAIPYQNSYINPTGNHGMATAGSGDVLSGMIAGLIVTGAKAEAAAPLGVYLHGRCGDEAAKSRSAYAMTASDLLAFLPDVMKSYESFFGSSHGK